MNTTIIAVAGRKQSGKSSLCAFIQAKAALKGYEDAGLKGRMKFEQRLTGEIDWYERGSGDWHPTFDGNQAVAMASFEQFAKVYNFADTLKDACVSMLGLRPEQCFGTDADKNSLTPLLWDNLPAYVRWNFGDRTIAFYREADKGTFRLPVGGELTEDMYNLNKREGIRFLGHRTGPMTGREVMQVFGTDVMRKMFFNDVWVNATVNRINAEKKPLALVADMRFRSELKALYPQEAYVIRLERNILNDQHSSEVDFDGFDWSPYAERTLIVPADADLPAKNRIVWNWLTEKLPHLFSN